MVLMRIKEVVGVLNFVKKSFTRGGFRHVTNYVNGLISMAKKTVNKIAEAAVDEKHQSALNRILNKSRFEKEKLEQRYLKKIRHLFKGHDVFLLIDDTLVERNGKNIEGAQKHFDHTTNTYVHGHQFFTAILYTSFLQLPLFPELYSKISDSKIDMANKLVTKLNQAKVKIHTMLFDSWYSDKKLLKTCIKANIRVICGIKTNRKVKIFKERNWRSLKFVSQQTRVQKLHEHNLDNKTYDVWSRKAYLYKLSLMRLVISRERKEGKIQDHPLHLISTKPENTTEEILSTYKIRWRIETYHRDIKQNLGFAKAYFRKKEGIVRHAILTAIAYATLNLFMYHNKIQMTIGTCCDYLRDKAQNDIIAEIISIEDKPTRVQRFEEAFIT